MRRVTELGLGVEPVLRRMAGRLRTGTGPSFARHGVMYNQRTSGWFTA